MHQQAEVSQKKKLRTNVEVFLSDVSHRWEGAVKDGEKVLVLSPYLTRKAETILAATPGERIEVYTAFLSENFASGASSIHTLQNLKERGCSLYHLPDLHAKIVLVPGHFVSIGSQNVTTRGTHNKEASAGFILTPAVETISRMIEPWLAERRSITQEMLNEMMLAVHELRTAMRTVQRACRALDAKLWAEERLRAAERERVEKQQQEEDRIREMAEQMARAMEARQRKLESEVATAKRLIASWFDDDYMLCFTLIGASAWWLTQRHGPTNAPKHAARLRGDNGSRYIAFGANLFQVSYAIRRGRFHIESWLDQKLAGENPALSSLKADLEYVVATSVSHEKTDRLYPEYPVVDGYLTFGSNAINVDRFVDHFIDLTLPGITLRD